MALARLYDTILDADFDQVPARVRQTCPPAAPEFCQVLTAVAIWWEISLDPDSRQHDAGFVAAVEAAITSSEAWTKREPQRAEAWFALGASYGARAQWRVLRKERLAAARDGKRIKRGARAMRSRSTRCCTMPGSASACTAITPTSRRRRCGCCAGCCCCPAAIAPTVCD